MIFITGDTHGTHDYGKVMSFAAKHKELTRDDYLIICGDFGAVWDKGTLTQDLKPYTKLHCTVLFVDGNHENFDLLSTFPVEEWKGGKIHKVADNVFHLMRGQVYTIEGKTFLTFGGATSIDRIYRIEGKSWWSDELPTYVDLEEARKNLAPFGNKVDYIVTHSCDERALYYPPLRGRDFQAETYPENYLLNALEESVDYGHWFFGHYHMDGDLIEGRKTVLYQNVVRLV